MQPRVFEFPLQLFLQRKELGAALWDFAQTFFEIQSQDTLGLVQKAPSLSRGSPFGGTLKKESSVSQVTTFFVLCLLSHPQRAEAARSFLEVLFPIQPNAGFFGRLLAESLGGEE